MGAINGSSQVFNKLSSNLKSSLREFNIFLNIKELNERIKKMIPFLKSPLGGFDS